MRPLIIQPQIGHRHYGQYYFPTLPIFHSITMLIVILHTHSNPYLLNIYCPYCIIHVVLLISRMYKMLNKW
ncbi:hypothetical protein L208DRAFT_127199 [Tricholoma matsutake]|nr:hypothetical protein L208DRAFT_127199 [Tricholoma matsutake 945]